MADIGLKLQVMRRESNLAGHIRWFEYLASENFVTDWYKAVGQEGFLERLVESARQIVQTDIYNVYSGYQGDGNIKASMTGERQSSTEGQTLIVYSDPSVAQAKQYPTFSYAAFFEEPKFRSFLPPDDDPHDVRKFRPFYFAMQLAQSRLSNEGVVQRLFTIIRRHMPRVGQE